MGWFDNFRVGDVSGVGSVADLATSIVERIWPDKTEEEKQRLAAELAVIQGQLAINQAEASNPSMFVAGWRPFVGWVGGTALAWQYIGAPVFGWVAALCGSTVTPPIIDSGPLMSILGSLLGIGMIGRSVEKVMGKAGKGS